MNNGIKRIPDLHHSTIRKRRDHSFWHSFAYDHFPLSQWIQTTIKNISLQYFNNPSDVFTTVCIRVTCRTLHKNVR